ncbi:hypothetical protein ACF08W_34630 [Streptomyces sp. NPDC015144]|uniref:hypothetical protein n=1 Tax=Streptomyces sp. NPDC015144 TaxID=3364944 RepID=UPI00370327BC
MFSQNTTNTWPKDVVARYLTVGTATVDLTYGSRYYATDNGIGETRNHTTSCCTGCGAIQEFSHWRVIQRFTFDDKVRDVEAADQAAREWAQEHAGMCRAMARPDGI